MSGFPPSLQSSPARIRRYLRTHKVTCRKCGYPLLGLPEPRCPECGTWTDVTDHLRIHNLRLITNRLESLGTADEWLLRCSSRKLLWTCRFDDVKELRVVTRWSGRIRRWLIILGSLALAEAFAFFVILANYPGPIGALGMAVSLLAGMCLLFLAVGLEPQTWVLAQTPERSYKVPMYLNGAAEAQKGVDRFLEVMEESRTRPPAPELDDAAEEVKEGCCRRCGYDLKGPRLMVALPNQGAQVVGFLIIVLSFLFLLCSGLAGLDYRSSSFDLLPCAAVFALTAGGFILGIWLFRRKQEGPAVPDWKGPGQCSACGWRAMSESPPVARNEPNQAPP